MSKWMILGLIIAAGAIGYYFWKRGKEEEVVAKETPELDAAREPSTAELDAFRELARELGKPVTAYPFAPLFALYWGQPIEERRPTWTEMLGG